MGLARDVSLVFVAILLLMFSLIFVASLYRLFTVRHKCEKGLHCLRIDSFFEKFSRRKAMHWGFLLTMAVSCGVRIIYISESLTQQGCDIADFPHCLLLYSLPSWLHLGVFLLLAFYWCGPPLAGSGQTPFAHPTPTPFPAPPRCTARGSGSPRPRCSPPSSSSSSRSGSGSSCATRRGS